MQVTQHPCWRQTGHVTLKPVRIGPVGHFLSSLVPCDYIFFLGPVPNGTPCALAVLRTYNGCRLYMSVKSTRLNRDTPRVGCPIPHCSVQKCARERPLCGVMRPRSTLLPSPHWGELRSRLLPNSQSGITSRKCGLRGRPLGFRVPFGTGPWVSFEAAFWCHIQGVSDSCHYMQWVQWCTF